MRCSSKRRHCPYNKHYENGSLVRVHTCGSSISESDNTWVAQIASGGPESFVIRQRVVCPASAMLKVELRGRRPSEETGDMEMAGQGRSRSVFLCSATACKRLASGHQPNPVSFRDDACVYPTRLLGRPQHITTTLRCAHTSVLSYPRPSEIPRGAGGCD